MKNVNSLDGRVCWSGLEVSHARGWGLYPNPAFVECAAKDQQPQGRRQSGVIDVCGWFRVYARETPLCAGQIAALSLYVSSTEFWLFHKVLIERIDSEAEDLIVRWSFAGADDGGSIIAPNGTIIGG